MRSWLALGVFAVVSWLAACGGSSPQTPSSPPPTPDAALATGTTLSVLSGENGQSVGGARLVVAGRTYDADASGHVTLAERVPFGSFVDVVAPGFLDRQTLIRQAGDTRFVLWPRTTTSGLSERYTTEIVYTAGTATPTPPGSSPLRRLRTGTTQVFVVLSEEIRQDSRAHLAHEEGVAMLNAALAGRVVYALAASRPASGIVFESRVDPADPLCAENDRILAFTVLNLQGEEATGGRVVFCESDATRREIVAHELAHTVGLQHSPDPRELMARFYTPASRRDFGSLEVLSMSLLLERHGGNRFPDNDRDVPASARGGVTIVCN
ncbi:MAG: matrixin family metalloprotease [Solirubrobacterales bacterium]